MPIDKQQIHKIASLAKLRVDDEDVQTLSEKFDSIVQLIDQLEQADTKGVEPLSHPQDPTLRLREDVVTQTNERGQFLALTPHHADGLYLVPKVIE